MPCYLPTIIAYGRTSHLIGHGFSMGLKKCTARYRHSWGCRSLPSEEDQIRHTATDGTGTVESSPQHTSWFHLFTYKRFHVLLNSLFKVLCNFPSRYLFAIGLAVIFSLRWSLPPALGCTLKQPDSSKQQFAHMVWQRYGPSTRYGKVLVRGT